MDRAAAEVGEDPQPQQLTGEDLGRAVVRQLHAEQQPTPVRVGPACGHRAQAEEELVAEQLGAFDQTLGGGHLQAGVDGGRGQR
ncbi:hypothetical protein BBK82_16645 [Lentzea guizhouensis]|uniref:Uncharacterized protein n=1 Tax=Lentzea guizhouensis TaxID=1586287 RepID=A0A1B2HI79_9PSEU|nr:hypothetical protein [Lentzea guizhouensis]ANZ37438.1 hypothetical protein BBK82_16645 [Lentzea guizhouensis]